MTVVKTFVFWANLSQLKQKQFAITPVLHHIKVKIGSVILLTKSYSEFNRRDNSFMKFTSNGTTKFARIVTFFISINDNLALVNISQIQNSLMDNFHDRSSMGKFSS